jgi:hypothetical protein
MLAIRQLQSDCNRRRPSRTDPHYERVYSKIKEMMENYEAKLSKTSFTPMETIAPKSYEICEDQERLQGGSWQNSERESD